MDCEIWRLVAHPGVAGDAAFAGKPFLLAVPGRDDPFTDLRGGFAGPFGGDFAKVDRRHFHMNVDPVGELDVDKLW